MSTIFLIDYGLAKRYRDATTLAHIGYRDHKELTGTARYASLNTHFGIEQSRRDDLECLAYSLIYLAKGELPWQGIKAKTKAEKYSIIQERKSTINPESLCKGIEIEFARFLAYSKSLKFEDKPDYNYARQLFRDCFYKLGFHKGCELDWIKTKLMLTLEVLPDLELSASASNHADKNGPTPGGREQRKTPHGDKEQGWSLMEDPQTHCLLGKDGMMLKAANNSMDFLQDLESVDKYGGRNESKDLVPKSLFDDKCNFRLEDTLEDNSILGILLVCFITD